jgi:hypothetical protein
MIPNLAGLVPENPFHQFNQMQGLHFESGFFLSFPDYRFLKRFSNLN